MTESASIYKSPAGKARCMALYEAALRRWPVPYQELDLPTRYGCTHVIASGPQDGRPLVLLHGQWASATMWSVLVAELGGNTRIYALDQIDDVGKSVPDGFVAGRPAYAAWLQDVFDRLGLRQADLAGLSYGGFLALNFALAAPDRVSRMVLLCPGVPSFGRPTLQWALHGLPMTLFPSEWTARWLVQGLSARGYRPGEPETEMLIAAALSLNSRIPFRPVIAQDEFDRLGKPVQLLIGERESMYEPRSAMRRARQLIPQVQAELIPAAGHMLTSDQPGPVIERIRRFLAG